MLTTEEVRGLIAACPRRGPTGLRDRALIVVLWRTGLRISEALALYPKDVDRAGGTVTVLSGKGMKRRTVGIDPTALAVLERWIDVRPKLGFTGRHPLFCTIARDARTRGPGHQLYASAVRDMLKRRALKAGIEKRVHPHGLRHTHAYELVMEGVPINVVQAQLGHNSLGVTDRYVRHLAPVALIQAVRAREWSEAA